MYGRFASPDPARDQHFEQTQSWNIYSYVQNNPVMNTDPTGLWTWKGVWEETNKFFNYKSHQEVSKAPAADGHGTTRKEAVDVNRKVSGGASGARADFKVDASKEVTSSSIGKKVGPITLEGSGEHKKEFISTETAINLNSKEASIAVGGQVGQPQTSLSGRVGVDIPFLGVNIGLGGSAGGGVAIGLNGKITLAEANEKTGDLSILKGSISFGIGKVSFNGISIGPLE